MTKSCSIGVGLDSEKRILGKRCEKMRKERKYREKMGKEAIRNGKGTNDIIESSYFSGIRIFQYDVNCFEIKKYDVTEKLESVNQTGIERRAIKTSTVYLFLLT